MRDHSSSARSRAAGRARLRTITAFAGVASVAGVAGIAVALHSAAAAAESSTTGTTSNSDRNTDGNTTQLQAPDSAPRSTQQAPLATSNGS